MTGRDCEIIRDLLPSFAVRSLPPEEAARVEEHLQSCGLCREELEVVRGVLAARPEVPSDLEASIRARLREDLPGFGEGLSLDSARDSTDAPREERRTLLSLRRSPWGLSAAAILVLALGTGVIWSRQEPEAMQDPFEVASQEAHPEAWLWDDGIVAGAPVFDALSDEDLEALLEEYEG